MKLNNITSNARLLVGRASLKIKKREPEILLGGGIVCLVGTVILASKATLKADDILKEHEKKINDIKQARELSVENPEVYDYNPELVRHDITTQYLKTSRKLLKLYAPSIACGCASIGFLISSRNVLNRRYLAAVSSYNAACTAFKEYRERVIEDQGENADKCYRLGLKRDTVTKTIEEDGKKKKVKDEVLVKDENSSPIVDGTSVIFNAANPNWHESLNFRKAFLNAKSSQWTDVLQTRGHVFLNEVLDDLGFEQTSIGALAGWVLGAGDDYIDFGISDYDLESMEDLDGVLLTFNHDGAIWDKI